MSTIRILFLGTPEFARAHLQSLLDDDHFEVVGVVSQPDRPAGRKMQLQPSPVKALAVEKNIPVITPEKVNTPEVLEQIQAFKAEAAVVVAFGQILPQKFLDFY
ncbi:MAG: formyltransferase family protein, partial [Bdellovibrionota bacterium]